MIRIPECLFSNPLPIKANGIDTVWHELWRPGKPEAAVVCEIVLTENESGMKFRYLMLVQTHPTTGEVSTHVDWQNELEGDADSLPASLASFASRTLMIETSQKSYDRLMRGHSIWIEQATAWHAQTRRRIKNDLQDLRAARIRHYHDTQSERLQRPELVSV